MTSTETTQRRIEQLLSLFASGQTLTANAASGGLVPSIAESAARLLGAEHATVSLIDQETSALVPIYTWPNAASRLSPPQGTRLEVQLAGRSGLLGTIEVRTERAFAFTAEDVHILTAFAGQATSAMESSRLIQELTDGKHAWEETFDAISEGICVRDQLCHIVKANRALADLIGRPASAIIGERLCAQIPELEPTCNVCHAPAGWDDRHAALLGVPAELKVGGTTPSLWTVTDFPARVSDLGIVSWVTLVKDVSTERRMQEALVRSEQMRAIGEMASGVAHDFNNLLSTILHRSELSLSGELPADLRHSIETIRSAALDGVATVRRIQEYSRVRHDVELQITSLPEALQAAIELSRHRWADEPARSDRPIRLATEIDPLPLVRGNPSELREVFMNLILNAVDAMPAGGTLSIRGTVEGDFTVIEVADTGIGMASDVLARVFDPFYTTKGERGNGLGLSIAYGILTRSGGSISAASTPGNGTAFTVRLPVASPQLVESNATKPTIPPASIDPVRILLVDDDHQVREGLAELLRQDRHSVAAYAGAREALDDYRRGAFDCVITDLGMPEIDGWAFARELRTMDPEIPLVLLTGWQAELSTNQMEGHGVSSVLSKPCSQADLRRVIASLTAIEPAALAPARALSVLVVDDQIHFAEAVADRLRLEGCQVVIAGSGAAAMQEARSRQFDLALVDLRLPDISGIEVAAQIRDLAQRPYLVLTSGLALAADDPDLMQNVDQVLPKPWQADELRVVLTRARQHVLRTRTVEDHSVSASHG